MKKAMMIGGTVVAAMLLAATISVIFIMNFMNKEPEKSGPSIDEVVELSVEVPEITTNLSNGGFAKVSFMIQTDNADAKEELAKREFQVKNIILRIVSQMKPSDFQGEEGLLTLENSIREQTNKIMQSGTVVEVYATSFIIS
ncbi:MAG: flagellar basal body-associated protein FliL [Bacilli bacterium]